MHIGCIGRYAEIADALGIEGKPTKQKPRPYRKIEALKAHVIKPTIRDYVPDEDEFLPRSTR